MTGYSERTPNNLKYMNLWAKLSITPFRGSIALYLRMGKLVLEKLLLCLEKLERCRFQKEGSKHFKNSKL